MRKLVVAALIGAAVMSAPASAAPSLSGPVTYIGNGSNFSFLFSRSDFFAQGSDIQLTAAEAGCTSSVFTCSGVRFSSDRPFKGKAQFDVVSIYQGLDDVRGSYTFANDTFQSYGFTTTGGGSSALALGRVPAAPGPEAGFGLVPALAGGVGLLATRLRRRKRAA